MTVSSIGPRALVFGKMDRNPNADSAGAAANLGPSAATTLNVYNKGPKQGETAYRGNDPNAEPKPDESKFEPNTMDTDPSNPLR